MLGAVTAFFSGVAIYLWLPETAQRAPLSMRHSNSEADDVVLLEMSTTSDETIRPEQECKLQPAGQDNPTVQILPWWRKPRVILPCLLYAFHSMNSMWLNESFPLWCLGSVIVGGLGMTLYEIGMMVSAASLFLIVFQIFAFHRLVDRYGPSKVFSGAALCMAAPVFSLPYTSYALSFTQTTKNATVGNVTGVQNELIISDSSRLSTLAAVAILFGLASSASVSAFSSVFMLINNSVTTDKRASVNGLAMTIASGTKAVGPILGSSILAWTFEKGRTISWFLATHLDFLLQLFSGSCCTAFHGGLCPA